jgi:hypothetical protein
LESLLKGVELAAAEYSWEGVERPVVLSGKIGSDARALGGASLPIYAQFAPDRDLFLFSKDSDSADSAARSTDQEPGKRTA